MAAANPNPPPPPHHLSASSSSLWRCSAAAACSGSLEVFSRSLKSAKVLFISLWDAACRVFFAEAGRTQRLGSLKRNTKTRCHFLATGQNGRKRKSAAMFGTGKCSDRGGQPNSRDSEPRE